MRFNENCPAKQGAGDIAQSRDQSENGIQSESDPGPGNANALVEPPGQTTKTGESYVIPWARGCYSRFNHRGREVRATLTEAMIPAIT